MACFDPDVNIHAYKYESEKRHKLSGNYTIRQTKSGRYELKNGTKRMIFDAELIDKINEWIEYKI